MKRSTKLKIGAYVSFGMYLLGIYLLAKAGNHILIGVLALFISKDTARQVEEARKIDEENNAKSA